jgi:hypothetical protein
VLGEGGGSTSFSLETPFYLVFLLMVNVSRVHQSNILLFDGRKIYRVTRPYVLNISKPGILYPFCVSSCEDLPVTCRVVISCDVALECLCPRHENKVRVSTVLQPFCSLVVTV